ncbi:hypothetical protein PLEOSDRAFT_1073225 [Pleurotus ostreatus PC15]|uniref:Ketopantoate reductase N-terminal domain-containing protein n=1 Tax=Pleurotus ostreatus (strain PC15) TaxID=1137138 RepID=A0A067NY78_PLEO1|nr:hypothetical protein PLEOSDRAFT_1073225 [Pleurotus ostreatus PC15]
MKEVLLVGFGAVGALCTLTSKSLSRSGIARVTAVARSNYGIVRGKYSLCLTTRRSRVCNTVASAADQAYDYVVVTTKAVPELRLTPEILSPLLSPEYTNKFAQPTYLLLQNGLNVEKDLYNAIRKLNQGKPSIVCAALYVGTNLAAPNVVVTNDLVNHFSQRESLFLGIYRHEDHTTSANSADETALLQDLGSIFQRGGSAITIVPEIQRVKFAKNFWNLSFATFATLTGYTVPSLFRSPPASKDEQCNPYLYPITAELVQQHSIPAIKTTMKELLNRDPDNSHVPSMLLDARRSQPMEVEVIVGEVHIDMLYALLLVKQNQILGRMMAQ